jgi:hypothetical protein
MSEDHHHPTMVEGTQSRDQFAAESKIYNIDEDMDAQGSMQMQTVEM